LKRDTKRLDVFWPCQTNVAQQEPTQWCQPWVGGFEHSRVSVEFRNLAFPWALESRLDETQPNEVLGSSVLESCGIQRLLV
jgi:hypothetical protein